MSIIDRKYWDKQVKINKDPYSKTIIDVAREVMRLLDTPEYQDFSCHKIICDAEKNINAGNITCFVAWSVAFEVSRYHSRGEEFRKKWNADFGVSEDKAKVVLQSSNNNY